MTRSRRRAGEAAGEAPFSGWRPPAFVLVLAILAPLMTALPAVSAALREPPAGKVFLGFPYMVTDHLQYASFVHQGEAGRLVMEDMFTTEPQRPSFILLYFDVVGTVVRVTGLAIPVAWELMRAIGAFGLMLAAWYFTGCFFDRKAERILAYVMIGFSGGLGWLAGLLPAHLLERPGYGFLTDPAHFQWNWSTFSAMLVGLWIPPLLLFLLASMLLLSRRRMPEAVRAAGLFALGPLIWFFHPHGGNVAYFTIGLFGLMPAFEALWKLEPFPWRKTLGSIGRVLPYLLSFGVIVAYLLWASKDAVFAAGGEGAARWNPAYSVFWYPLTYGLLVPLGALGLRWCGSMPERPRHLILSWLAASVILSVNPLFSGVKYQFMVHLPLAVLSAHGIVELRRRSAWARRAATRSAGVIVGAALLLHAPVTIVRDSVAPPDDPNAYAERTVVDAARFLERQPPGAVLSGYGPGGVIADVSGKKVFMGHWLLTVNLSGKSRELAGFFSSGVSLDAKRRFLSSNGIRYVFVTSVERRLGSVDPALGLQTLYDKGGVTIYKVP